MGYIFLTSYHSSYGVTYVLHVASYSIVLTVLLILMHISTAGLSLCIIYVMYII